MTTKTVRHIMGYFFLIIGLVHLTRFLLRWDASIAGWSIPLWVSIVITLFAGSCAYESLRKRKEVRYVCTGGCNGVSLKPGMCQSEGCIKKGKALEECRV
ncbi:MAG: hypothetical protein NUV53_03450 [Patescibacteria group bacterium]|nr:hypothetical protein [Patescibacteria group bacterium]